MTRYNEVELNIFSKYQDDFKEFRNYLHQKLRGYDEGKAPARMIETKVPGKIRVLGGGHRHDDHHGNNSTNLLNQNNRTGKGRYNKANLEKKAAKEKNTFHQLDDYLTLTLDQMKPSITNSVVTTEKNFEVNSLNHEEDQKDDTTKVKETFNKITRQSFGKLIDMQEMKIDIVKMQWDVSKDTK